jgi:tetratricopeptide (TPR) repeat protein
LELIGIVLTLAVISIAAIANRKTRPYWLVGWLWFLVTLCPLMGLLPGLAPFLPAGAQPMADRNMYIPSIGLWMLFCWEAYDLAATWRVGRAVLGGLCAVLLAACCVASSMQLLHWKNEDSFAGLIPDSSVNAIGHASYAEYLLHHNQMDLAQAEAEKAAAINPNRAAFSVLLGETLLSQGKYDQAVEKCQSALRLNPTMDSARLVLGEAFLAKNRAADAVGEFNTVLADDPHNFAAHNCLARTFMSQGRTRDAVAQYHASLATQTNQPITLNELAWLLATDPHVEIRRGEEAVQLAERACALTQGQEPVFLGTLAAAYAETGDFQRAVQAGQEAQRLASQQRLNALAENNPALAQSLNALAETNSQLVARYQDHKPFREKH